MTLPLSRSAGTAIGGGLSCTTAQIVGPGELPDGWGLLAIGARIRVVTQAPRLSPAPLPPGLIAALIRAAIRGGKLGGEDRHA